MTVVFCDVVGSTPLGERLDPESVRRVMTRFFERMRHVLERHGGTVEKYIGDAVMAVFGVPELHEDDALRAVRAAAEMRDELADLNAELEPSLGVSLRTRVGVNTGPVVVGDQGGGPLVIGDAVNVAARLEQAAEPGEIVLGGSTYALVRSAVTADEGQPIALRGKAETVAAHRLLDVQRLPGGVVRLHPGFIGRTPQLDALQKAFDRSAQDRTCVLLTVLADAGVGKSRLAEEFTASTKDRARVVGGRCLPYGDGITFWPITELVRGACGIATADRRDMAQQKMLAVVGREGDAEAIVEGLAAVSGFGDASSTIQEIFWAVRRFLEVLQQDRPLQVVFDDLQWAEPTFLDLIEYVAARSHDARILLLCLARPEILDVRPAWTAQPNGITVSLEPLTEAESEHLIADLLGAPLLDPSDAARIVAAADGNPLFVEELLRMLEDDGLLARQEDGWRVSADVSGVPVPASISALLAARLDRLTPDEKTVLGTAAVIGQDFWWSAVADLLPEDQRAGVGSRLQTLVRKGLIAPERSTMTGQDAFAFHHLLIRDASYEALSKERRAQLHQRFAEWVDLRFPARAAQFEEVVGHHLEQACRYRRELGLDSAETERIAARGGGRLASAGRRAMARGDVTAAVSLLDRAAALYAGDVRARASLLPDLSDALIQSGELGRAGDVLGQARTAADIVGDRGLLGHAAIMQLLLMESTDPKELAIAAPAELARVIPVFEQLGDHLGLARAWRLQADLHWTRARYAQAGEALQHAIAHAEAGGSTWEQAELLGQFTGAAVYGPTPVDDAVVRCETVLTDHRGDDLVAARVLRSLAALRAMQGRFAEAREQAARAAAILTELGMRLPAAFASETRGFVERLAGDHAAAEAALRAGHAGIAELAEQGYQSTVAALLAQVLVAQDRPDDAEPFLAEAEAAAADDDVTTHVVVQAARGRVAAAHGNLADAEARCREAVALASTTDDLNMRGDALLDLARVLAAKGDAEAARSTAGMAAGLFDTKGNIIQAADARTVLG